MQKAPKSWVNRRRIPLHDAMKLEGVETFDEGVKILVEKGYFTPQPGPWKIGGRDRGHDHVDYAVMDKFGDIVAEMPNRVTAELVISAVNSYRKKGSKK